MSIVIEVDTSSVEAGLKALGADAGKAVARSINRTAENVRTVMVRAVAAEMRMAQKYVRDRVHIIPAASGRVTVITASNAPTPVILFGAKGPEPSRGRGRGVTAKTKKRRYPNAFITSVTGPLPNGVVSPGHRGVFVRVGDAVRRSKGAWSNNLRIRELKESSIWAVWMRHRAIGQRRGEEMLPKNLAHEVQYLLQTKVQSAFNRGAGVRRVAS